jgi:hypothetical protein
MPSYLSNKPRDQFTYVLVAGNNVYYGFKTKSITQVTGVTADDLVALGHLDPTAVPQGGLRMLRAQAPKPPRAKKTVKRNPSVSEQGSVSTFYGLGRETQVTAAGWDLLNGARAASLTANARTISAIARLSNGMYYVFPLNTEVFNAYASQLGLVSPATINTATEEAKLVRGASRPRPGRAIKELNGGGTLNTFFSTDAFETVRQNGFKVISKEQLI